MARCPARAIAAAGFALVVANGSSTFAARTALSNADGSYETAYIPREDVLLPPDYGAFAERYSGTWEVVGVTLEFTQIGIWGGSRHDLFLWLDDGTGSPGSVLCVRQVDLQPQPAYWPDAATTSTASPPVAACRVIGGLVRGSSILEPPPTTSAPTSPAVPAPPA